MKIELKRDGLTLRGVYNQPDASHFDLVILMHGFMGNKGDFPQTLLYELAANFEQNGIATLRFDFNGQGQSDGDFKDMTVWNEIADAKVALDYAHKIDGVDHIYLLGHSQGGVVASMLAGYYPDIISKLILISPAATLKEEALKGEILGVDYDPDNIPDELHDFGSKVVGGFYLRTNQSIPIYGISMQYQGPVCLIHGSQDCVVSPKASEKYATIYHNNEFHLIPNADHVYMTGDSMKRAIQISTDFLMRSTQAITSES